MKLFNPFVRFLRYFRRFYITNLPQTSEISKTRDITTLQSREIKTTPKLIIAQSSSETKIGSALATAEPDLVKCPYCSGSEVVKRGLRKKKLETVQLYFCHHCKKTFVWQRVKGRKFPLRIILEGLSLYNLGWRLEESCQRLKEQFGLEVKPSTLSDWAREFESLCRYSRLRPYALKLYSPNQIIQTVHLYHHQVYDFSVHRGKLALLLQEYKNNKFDNLREFLEAIQSECPHQFFKEGERASDWITNPMPPPVKKARQSPSLPSMP